jgi:lipopolysaccharide assembly protein A
VLARNDGVIREKSMRILTYLIFLIILLIGITFAYLNATPVIFNYYLGTDTIPLSLLMTLSFGVGIICGVLISIVNWICLKSQNYLLKKRLQSLEQNLVVSEYTQK